MMMKTTYIPQVQNTPPTAYKYATVNCFSQNKNKSIVYVFSLLYKGLHIQERTLTFKSSLHIVTK